MTAETYKAKRELLCSSASKQPDEAYFLDFVEKVCREPLRSEAECARFWLSVWSELDSFSRQALTLLPDPCLKHLEDRARRPERSRNLSSGAKRLAAFDVQLLLDGIRLFPHALCRVCEAVGPLPESLWTELQQNVAEHRLWNLGPMESDADFWAAAERLLPHRQLPQSLIDLLESGRPRETASVRALKTSLERFLVRARLETVRFSAYDLLTGVPSSA